MMAKKGNYNYAVPVDEHSLLKELYEGGLSLRTIASKFDTTSTTIRRTLINLGTKLRPVGKPSESFD